MDHDIVLSLFMSLISVLVFLSGGGKRICNGVSRHFQQYFSYIVAVSFIGGANRKTLEKTTELSQVTDKLYHILLYTLP